MQSKQPAASAAQLTDLLNVAGAYNQLTIARWLRRQGAEWPAVLGHDDLPWRTDVLQWARDEGCASPNLD
jgi:hypothetical protein